MTNQQVEDLKLNNLQGQCLCGAVTYEIQGLLGAVYHCHCKKCRRWHNAAFRTRAAITKRQFAWLSGTDYLAHHYSSSTTKRSFCKQCGSNLINTYDDKPDIIGLPLGGLDNLNAIKPIAHIFVKYKAPWYEILDDLPQYDEWPDNLAATVHQVNNG